MANIFAILTAIVLAVSAFLAYVNMGDSSEEGRGYRGWISKRQTEEQSLARNEKKLAELTAQRDNLIVERDKFVTANTGLQTEVDAQLDKNKTLQSDVDDKKAAAETKKESLEKMKADFVDVGDVEDVILKLQSTQRALTELKIEITGKEAKRATLQQQANQTQASIDTLRDRIGLYSQKKSSPNLRTRVRSVYRDLGFVTLAGGDNLGIIKDSTLEVVRGGETIGKLLVTAVEAGTSAADIVPDSFAEGEAVLVGDTVVAAGDDPAPAAPTPPPAAAPAPAPAEVPAAEPEAPMAP
ncbi:MAG: hypothetical protein HKN82_17010 [Akkermansiaceae bacterium]|nr:hypothetical protein [Akkermansiaceae bacterium]NNM28623.1 hypothetical protein [Akkermansiaceae bacterium]